MPASPFGSRRTASCRSSSDRSRRLTVQLLRSLFSPVVESSFVPHACVQTGNDAVHNGRKSRRESVRVDDLLLLDGVNDVDRGCHDAQNGMLLLLAGLGAEHCFDTLNHARQKTNTAQKQLQEIHLLFLSSRGAARQCRGPSHAIARCTSVSSAP